MEAYIDQKATVESLNAMKPFLRDRGQVQLLRRIMNHIGKIPVADVVPVVHGKWVWKNGWIVCNKCEALYAVCPNRNAKEQALKDAKGLEKFCFNCGAKMDGE